MSPNLDVTDAALGYQPYPGRLEFPTSAGVLNVDFAAVEAEEIVEPEEPTAAQAEPQPEPAVEPTLLSDRTYPALEQEKPEPWEDISASTIYSREPSWASFETAAQMEVTVDLRIVAQPGPAEGAEEPAAEELIAPAPLAGLIPMAAPEAVALEAWPGEMLGAPLDLPQAPLRYPFASIAIMGGAVAPVESAVEEWSGAEAPPVGPIAVEAERGIESPSAFPPVVFWPGLTAIRVRAQLAEAARHSEGVQSAPEPVAQHDLQTPAFLPVVPGVVPEMVDLPKAGHRVFAVSAAPEMTAATAPQEAMAREDAKPPVFSVVSPNLEGVTLAHGVPAASAEPEMRGVCAPSEPIERVDPQPPAFSPVLPQAAERTGEHPVSAVRVKAEMRVVSPAAEVMPWHAPQPPVFSPVLPQVAERTGEHQFPDVSATAEMRGAIPASEAMPRYASQAPVFLPVLPQAAERTGEHVVPVASVTTEMTGAAPASDAPAQHIAETLVVPPVLTPFFPRAAERTGEHVVPVASVMAEMRGAVPASDAFVRYAAEAPAIPPVLPVAIPRAGEPQIRAASAVADVTGVAPSSETMARQEPQPVVFQPVLPTELMPAARPYQVRFASASARTMAAESAPSFTLHRDGIVLLGPDVVFSGAGFSGIAVWQAIEPARISSLQPVGFEPHAFTLVGRRRTLPGLREAPAKWRVPNPAIKLSPGLPVREDRLHAIAMAAQRGPISKLTPEGPRARELGLKQPLFEPAKQLKGPDAADWNPQSPAMAAPEAVKIARADERNLPAEVRRPRLPARRPEFGIPEEVASQFALPVHADRRRRFRASALVADSIGLQRFRAASYIQIREPELRDSRVAELRVPVALLPWQSKRIRQETPRAGGPVVPLHPALEIPRFAA